MSKFKKNTYQKAENQKSMVMEESTEISKIQPLNNNKYFKNVFSVEGEQTGEFIKIGGFLDLMQSAGVEAATGITRDLVRDGLNCLQAVKQATISHLKIRTANVDVFNENLMLHYLMSDGTVKDIPIEFDEYVNEYSYKDKILTVPVGFLADSTRMFWSWNIVNPGGTGAGTDEDPFVPNTEAVSVTLFAAKMHNMITSI